MKQVILKQQSPCVCRVNNVQMRSKNRAWGSPEKPEFGLNHLSLVKTAFAVKQSLVQTVTGLVIKLYVFELLVAL